METETCSHNASKVPALQIGHLLIGFMLYNAQPV